MKFDSYSCDAETCSVVKGTNNHWFKFRSYANEGNGAEFIVNEWDSTGTDYPNTLHLCSDSCVIKTVQKWLSEQKELSTKGE